MKKLIALIGAVGLILTGCGAETSAKDTDSEISRTVTDETEEETTENVTEEITESETEEKQETVTETTENSEKSETGKYEVTLINSTGKDIKEISVKTGSESEYPANILESILEDSAETVIEYTAPDSNIVVEDSDTPVISEEYLIKIVFDDDTNAELHQFPFGDIEKGEIIFDDDTVYVKYTSVSTGDEISTLEAEKMTAQLNAVKEETTEAPKTEPVTETIIIEEPVQEEPQTEEPVQEEPQQEEPVQEEPQQEEPVQQEPVQEEPQQEEPVQEEPADPNSGCLGGGALFN